MKIYLNTLDGLRDVRITKKNISIFLKNREEFDVVYDPKNTLGFKSKEFAWGFRSASNQFDVVINENLGEKLIHSLKNNLNGFKVDFEKLMSDIGLPIDINNSKLN
jgi:hypothetical protein